MNLIKKSNFQFYFLLLILVIFSVYKFKLGLNLDESNSILAGDIVVRGNCFIKENWSLWQSTSFLITPLIYLYRIINNNNLDGVLLYFRYLYLFVQIIISIYTFHIFKKISKNEKSSILISLLSFCYYFNWHTINYKAIFYWSTWVLFLLLINYYYTHKVVYIIMSAFILSFGILGYPTLIFVTPFIIIYLNILYHNKKLIYLFLTICVVLGFLILRIFVLCFNINDLFFCVKMIFKNPAYSENILLKIIKVTLIFIIINMILYFPLLIKFIYKRENINMNLFYYFYLIAIYFFICILRPTTISASRIYYFMLFVFFYIPVHIRLNNYKEYYLLKLSWIYSLILMYIISLSTNQGIAKVGYGTIIAIFLFIKYLFEDKKIPFKYNLFSILTISIIFSFVFFVPSFPGGFTNILNKRKLVLNGPARNLYLEYETYNKYYRMYNVVKKYVKSNDNLLILADGWSSIGYLSVNSNISTYASENVSVNDNRLIYYYEFNKNKIPNIIIIDKNDIKNFDEWSHDNEVGKYIIGIFMNPNFELYNDFYIITNKEKDE